MKILLTGSICVGKTTLLNRLQANLPRGAVCLSELATELINSRPFAINMPENEGILPGMGEYHFREQTRREQEALEAGFSSVVCDRGIVDLIAHSRIFGGEDQQEWIAWTKTYDRIYLLETVGVPFDAERYPSGRDWHKFRSELDYQTRKLLKEQQLKYLSLGGSIEYKESVIRKEIERSGATQIRKSGRESI